MKNVICIASGNTGTDNQLRGLVLASYKSGKNINQVPVTRNCLLKSVDDIVLHPENFDSWTAFTKAVEKSVQKYLETEQKIPDVVVLPFDHSTDNDEKNVDNLACAVKNAFAKLGSHVTTMVMASRLYDYKHVDYVNVADHLLTPDDVLKLKVNKQLRLRTVKTLGVPSNISPLSIKISFAHLAQKAQQNGFENPLNKYRGEKIVLFSLGGITPNKAIHFTLKDVDRLIKSAKKMQKAGYKVAFTNSPRTPNNLTDYLYRQCLKLNIDFYNSKHIAQTEQERQNFRFYTGMYEDQFRSQAQTVGNIYPAILKCCAFVVNTHDSFSYTSDVAAVGIPSVVYTGNFIDKTREDCRRLYEICHQNGYVLNLEEAESLIQGGQTVKTKKMRGVSSQIISYLNKQQDIPVTQKFFER